MRLLSVFLRLLSLLLMFSTIPIAILALDTVDCQDIYRNYVHCRTFSYARLGLVLAVFAVGFLLWIILSQDEDPRS